MSLLSILTGGLLPLNGKVSPSCGVDEADRLVIRRGHKVLADIALSDITWVEIYKRDQLITDLVCIDIFKGTETKGVTIHENMAGFRAAMTRLEAMPGFNRAWRRHVIRPPFVEARLVAFRV